ncbi:MAG: hypothetical protein U1E34_12355 [Amaricoccus sp.]
MKVSVSDAKGQLTDLVKRAEDRGCGLLYVGDDFSRTDFRFAA